ncbi:MAG TPA: VanZ family protein [Thermoguttaceae bacterium]|nr:VanZ family protein [Thermoguttaceae bacterium]
MLTVRLVCAAYSSLLTLLLLVPDPLALLGLERIPCPKHGVGVHFGCFTVLALLVLAGRVVRRRVVLFGLLVAYAVIVELLQGFVPPRTVELRDLAENLLGLAAGAALWWTLKRYVLRARKRAG